MNHLRKFGAKESMIGKENGAIKWKLSTSYRDKKKGVFQGSARLHPQQAQDHKLPRFLLEISSQRMSLEFISPYSVTRHSEANISISV